jgi:hypothetical protein
LGSLKIEVGPPHLELCYPFADLGLVGLHDSGAGPGLVEPLQLRTITAQTLFGIGNVVIEHSLQPIWAEHLAAKVLR